MENGLSKLLMIDAVSVELENVVSADRLRQITDWMFEQPGEYFPAEMNAEIETAFVARAIADANQTIDA